MVARELQIRCFWHWLESLTRVQAKKLARNYVRLMHSEFGAIGFKIFIASFVVRVVRLWVGEKPVQIRAHSAPERRAAVVLAEYLFSNAFRNAGRVVCAHPQRVSNMFRRFIVKRCLVGVNFIHPNNLRSRACACSRLCTYLRDHKFNHLGLPCRPLSVRALPNYLLCNEGQRLKRSYLMCVRRRLAKCCVQQVTR